MPNRTHFRPRPSTIFAILGLCSLLALPAIGSQLYFRHDDSSFILFSARFHGSLLNVFRTDPSINVWGNLRGMSGYYRPTAYLQALALVRIFQGNAGVLMALAAATMAGAVALYYVVVRIVAGPTKAVIALYIALFGGVTLLYQSFRLMVPLGYLEIMAALICLLIGAKRRSTLFILLGGAFWFLASSRQSALFLVPVVVLTALVAVPRLTQAWPSRAAAVKRFTLLLSPFIVAVAAIVIVDSLGRGSHGVSVAPAYLAQRYRFYAETLFVGPRAVVLIPSFYYGAIAARRRAQRADADDEGLSLLSLGVAIVGAVAVAGVTELGPVSLVAVSALGARRQRALWVGMAWFLVGFCVYLVPEFYHQAYILEAFLGVGFLAACCTPALAQDVLTAVRSLWSAGGLARGATVAAVVLVMATCIVAGLLVGPSTLSAGRGAVTGLVNTNRTFKQSVDYLSSLEGGDATVLAFSNEQRGLFKENWRDLGLEYRATAVPVMDLPELQNMLTALVGPGMKLQPFAAPDGVSVPEGQPLYGIAFGEAESREMARSWTATPMKRLTNGDATATVFRLQPPPD